MAHSDLIQSLSRGLEILELAAEVEDGLTLQEIAGALGVLPTTAHNLARTLVAKRYLEKVQKPTRYRLGSALVELADRYRHRTLVQHAAEVMRELATRLPEVTLTVTEAVGHDVTVILRMSPERPGVLQQLHGQPVGPYVTAASLLFLAYWSEVEREAYFVRYPFDEFGAHRWKTPEHLAAFLDETRRTGVAVMPVTEKLRCPVAVPVFDIQGHLTAAIGMSMPVPAGETYERIARLLTAHVTAAARRLSLLDGTEGD